ncbi:MAG: prolyl oligopeptidase family serine peptidase [Chryseobacterium sp.]|uniref:alpha/beta hydrolase n=1 Tax=Chryseobacterium sp. TaxID=1871047 RepID=UPI001AFDCFCC|nr:alpha/beta hydrolase family protein [Chryseobacterium sp.]MBO6184806.1 prolyl oligopeptidase family serine peptidase [Chryseobacterium sp.]
MIKSLFTLVIAFIGTGMVAQKIDTLSVYSASMNKKIKTLVVSPSHSKNKKLPTVYVLHGYSGYPKRTLVQDIPSLSVLSEEMQMIFVLPDGNYDSWYIDSPNLKYETFIAKELTGFIQKNYSSDSSKTALIGWSMGGHGALYIGARHQKIFSAVGSICGVIDFVPFGKEYGVPKLLGENTENWTPYTAISQIDKLKNSRQKILISCGTEDILLAQNRKFHEQLILLNIPHIYEERPGAHDAAYWSKAAVTQIFQLNQFFTNHD